MFTSLDSSELPAAPLAVVSLHIFTRLNLGIRLSAHLVERARRVGKLGG